MHQQEREVAMDHILLREAVIDIECDVNMSQDAESPDLLDSEPGKISSAKVNAVVSLDVENGVSLSSNVKNMSDVSPVQGKSIRKEKRKSNSAKKPPKPPRPPRGLSLDAADQKLIKEIAELAMIKRARIERMKKMKAAKASSMSSSSGNLIAMLFTLLFFTVIIFQGMSPGNNSAAGFHGSPETDVGAGSGFIVVHGRQNIFTHNASSIGSGSPNPPKLAPGSDIKDNGNGDVG